MKINIQIKLNPAQMTTNQYLEKYKYTLSLPSFDSSLSPLHTPHFPHTPSLLLCTHPPPYPHTISMSKLCDFA